VTTHAEFKKAPGWLREAGQVAYKYRQHLQVIVLAAALFSGRRLPTSREDRAILALSALLVLLGGGLRSWAMGYHTWRRTKGESARRNLVTAGPYSLTRNPLYLGTFMIGCGIASMSGRLWLLAAFAVVFVISHYAIIRWEEGKLIGEFGDEFLDYFSRVPRLFPGVKLGAPPGPNPRNGRFSTSAMIRCMEPVKPLGFLAVIGVMAYMKSRGWTLGQ